MKLSARIATIELAETFVIARSAQDTADVVYVEIEHEGVTGYGEAAPIERYDQSAESALAYLEANADTLGDDPWALEEIESRLPPEEPAARAAIDAAFHDLQGKLAGLPVWRLLGLRRAGPPTSWTIWLGDPDDMARRTEVVAGRFKRLKLKLGGGDGLDVERVKAVRAATDLPLMVDVNEAWSVDEALEALPQLAQLGVEYCEQPIPAYDPGAATLKERSPIPIFVDEDCHVAADVPACAERAHGVNIKLAKSGGIREAIRIAHAARALGLGVMLDCMNESGRAIAHGVNIKLAKSGGIREAIRIAHAARAVGLGVMLGCMNESGLAIAAGAQIASLCDHVDLDGNLLLRHDPWPGVDLVDGVQLPSEQPGLGVVPSPVWGAAGGARP